MICVFVCLYLNTSICFGLRFLFQNWSFPNVRFLSYCTIAPVNMQDFINEFQEIICDGRQYELNLFGHKANMLKDSPLPENIKIYRDLNNFIKTI